MENDENQQIEQDFINFIEESKRKIVETEFIHKYVSILLQNNEYSAAKLILKNK